MPDQTLFDVQLYAVVRCKLERIAADSPPEAVEAARTHPQAVRWLTGLEDLQGRGAFAEEFSYFLVDVVGDVEFRQSCWYHAEETPLLQILRLLVLWDERGRADQTLDDLLTEVRHILSRSL